MVELFTHKYPYTDFHELNLDWIISKVIQMDTKLTNFVTLNTIKYADPLAWDITRQYEMNTVVIDPLTGTAYISTKPVPSGVSIGNTDYWTVIFDLQTIISYINDNLTIHNNGSSPTLLGDVLEGDWILWNNVLYYALHNMSAGTALIVDSNVAKASVEELTKGYTDALAAIVGLLADLNTSDKTSIVNAINSVLSDISTIIGSLADLNTTDKDSVVDAINECVSRLNTLSSMIGTLANLTTSNKTNVVNAINSLNTDLGNRISALESADVIYYNVKNYGAKGDGVTNDTVAVKAAIAKANTNHGIVYFPRGSYYITETLYFNQFGVGIMGENAQGTYLLIHHDSTAVRFGDGVNTKQSPSVQHIGIINYGNPSDSQYGIHFNNIVNGIMFDVILSNFKRGVFLNHAGNTALYSVGIVSNYHASVGFYITNRSVSTVLENCYVGFLTNAVDDSYGVSIVGQDIADITLKYVDVGNGIVGIYINGQDSPADTPPTDIRIIDPVIDGARYACIQIGDINTQGGVLIDGGWLNPLPISQGACIRLNNAYNIGITNVLMQQLSTDAPNCYGIIGSTLGRSQIVNNRFTHLASPITLEASSNYNIISGNNFSAYSSSAGFDIATDNSSYLVITDNVSQSTKTGFLSQSNGNSKCIITNNIALNKTGTVISGTNANSIVSNNITA